MPRQDAPRQRTLQRREAEGARRIAAQHKLVHAVAQSAYAVVENDGVGHGWATSTTVAPAGSKAVLFVLFNCYFDL